jgi:hypothetical protein
MCKWPLILLLFSSVAFADIGSVTTVTGTATIKRGSSFITVAKGTPIETNDRVESKSGDVLITFKDNTTVKVTSNSALVIDDFVYDPATQGGKLGLKAAEGTVRYVSGNIAHNNPNSVNIKTPTAAIAVRGTDFVMSVDETGKSLVVLMPTCEENVQIVNLKGLVCGSGAIDVESGGHIIHMDQPYQAVITETEGNAPIGPVVVNLNNTPIGNNLHLSPPQTLAGQSIQIAARTAAEKTGDVKKENSQKQDPQTQTAGVDSAAAQVTQQQQQQQQQQEEQQQQEAQAAAKSITTATNEMNALAASGVAISNSQTGDPNVFEIHQNNNPNLVQIGWGYASLSTNGHNYTNIALPTDTQVLVVVSQDRQIDAYNYASGAKAFGSITVIQNYSTATPVH